MRPRNCKAIWCETSSCLTSPCSGRLCTRSRWRLPFRSYLEWQHGSAFGAAMALNLWLGLYNASGEWPWTYMYLVVIQLIYLIDPPGRSLGVDALLWRREGTSRESSPVLTLVA